MNIKTIYSIFILNCLIFIQFNTNLLGQQDTTKILKTPIGIGDSVTTTDSLLVKRTLVPFLIKFRDDNQNEIFSTYRRSKYEINFSDYIQRISNHLFAMFSRKAKKIQLELDVGEFYLDIDKAIPCGLIINELVSNAFKHAFPDGKSGKIQIHLKNKLERYTIEVRDNGVGFPDNVDVRNTETLGLQLVNDLVKQIEGSYEIRQDDGTSFKIVF